MRFKYIAGSMLLAGLIAQSGSTLGTECASITINNTKDTNWSPNVEFKSCKTGKLQGGTVRMKSRTWNDAAVGSSITIYGGTTHNFTINEKVQPGSNVFSCPKIDDLRVGRCPRQTQSDLSHFQ